MLTKAVVFPLRVWSTINNSLKPIKRRIKVNKIKTQRRRHARRKLCTYVSEHCSSCVFSCSETRGNRKKTVGMFNKWQKSTRPAQT